MASSSLKLHTVPHVAPSSQVLARLWVMMGTWPFHIVMLLPRTLLCSPGVPGGLDFRAGTLAMTFKGLSLSQITWDWLFEESTIGH